MEYRIAGIIVTGFVSVIFFLMIYTQKIHRYRQIFFITIAICFFPSFINNLVQARGAMGLTETDIVKAEVPFCHIAIPFTIIPYALSQTLIFPARLFNHYASVYSMLLIWVLASLTLGRGWCSWVCFYGGWDEGFSALGKKKIINLNPSSPYARFFNFSVLIAVVLLSIKSMSIVYCEWFCPFKAITEYGETSSLVGYLQFIVMIVLFVGLLIVLPLLSKVRFQCSTFCPFGAFQSFFNKISPFTMAVNREKCTDCGLCIKKCPLLAISKESLSKGKVHITCTLCGKCQDECPKGAINLRFKWFKDYPIKSGKIIIDSFYYLLSPITVLSFGGLLIGSIVGGGFMQNTLILLLNWIGG